MRGLKEKEKQISHVQFGLPFAISVFLGAFLLFQVQPVIGKYILPWFGGSSSVWITSVLFFEVLLLFGYLYAYVITQLSLRKQIFLHSTLLIFSGLVIGLLFFFWNTPITPPLIFKLDTVAPVLQVFLILGVGVGLPYFMLSTTSSLLQRWYSMVQKKNSPYRLYALSNAGSLLGILSYPFLFEILLSLRIQGIGWSIGYIIYTCLLIWIARITIKNAKEEKKSSKTEIEKVPEKSKGANAYTYWFLLPFLSSIILLATTAKITQAVAPMPFLWLLPLGLYLLSFVLCFDSSRWYWRWFYPYFFLTSGVAAVWISLNMQSVILNLTVFSAFLFSTFMLLHGELYTYRPEPQRLNLYYFFIALGGAVGGLAVAVVAPLVLNDFLEFYIGIFLVAVVAIFVISDLFTGTLKRFHVRRQILRTARAVFLSLATVTLFGLIVYLFQTYFVRNDVLQKERNFYGTIAVTEGEDAYGAYRMLYNGDINHGSQYMTAELQSRPTQYYGYNSGGGLAITANKKRAAKDPSLNIGVVGLGVGTLATYGKDGDTVTFYEINPAVVTVAEAYFSYLKNSDAAIKVVLGDARLLMEKEQKSGKKPYDVLLVDAFTDDAIPVHLLTSEAFEIYLSLLNDTNGILAIHISNRYLDLFPLIRKMASVHNLDYAYIESASDDYEVASASWVLLAKNSDALSSARIQQVKSEYDDVRDVDIWTDDYSNLFQVVTIEQNN